MSTSVCAACFAPLLPHVGWCFDCDLRSEAPLPEKRSLRRIRVTVPRDGSQELALLVRRLDPTLSAADVSWHLRRGKVDIAGIVTLDQERALMAALDAAELRHEPGLPEMSPTPRIRLRQGEYATAKLAVTTVLGIAGAALGVPLVTGAAAVTALWVAARSIQLKPAEVQIDEAAAGALLGPVDERGLEKMREARTACAETQLLQTYRAFVVEVINASASMREQGRHLRSKVLADADKSLSAVILAGSNLVAVTSRALQSEPVSSQRAGPYRTLGSDREMVCDCLHSVRSTLADTSGKGQWDAESARVMHQLVEELQRAGVSHRGTKA